MNSKSVSSTWVARLKASPDVELRLFCFPYAGGNEFSFRGWADALPSWVELCGIQLPGRGNRLRKPPYTRLLTLVEELAEGIRPWLDRPFSFFGHSMGALTAFELTRKLRQSNLSEPVCLIVSGARAPQIARRDPNTFDLAATEFLEELRRLNGTPPEVLEHPELMALLMPLLRADFELFQTYVYREAPPINCPLAVFGGADDHEVTRTDLEAWRVQTTGRFSLKILPGDHFFVSASQSLLLKYLLQELYQGMNQNVVRNSVIGHA